MSGIKKLAGQTFVYGLSSILGRALNYLLTPLYAWYFLPEELGVIWEFYAYVGFFVVLLTYGLETTFFRFSAMDKPKELVYNNALLSLFFTSASFIAIGVGFSSFIAEAIHYPEQANYIIWFSIILGVDAFSSIPMAKLRQDSKPLKFAAVNLASIGVNILLNITFVWVLKGVFKMEIGVGVVFISNLVSTLVKPLVLYKEIATIKFKMDWGLFREMIKYTYPLIFVGLAGVTNEMLDRVLLKYLLWDEFGEEKTMTILGVYGANYKLAMIITMFIQAFRFAAEPFFFANEKDKDKVFGKVMTYTVVVMGVLFLVVTLYIDLFKYFIPNQVLWTGLKIVPVILFANIFLGIYYNLSIWYKLANRTKVGAYIAVFGALITIVLNVLWIPKYSYVGCAWATLICYFSMTLISFFLGQRIYPIKYDVKRAVLYLGAAILLYIISNWIRFEEKLLQIGLNTMLLGAYVSVVYLLEKPKVSLKMLKRK